ncbi:hypothetical protein U1Q18_022374 [Sarracenia purpurea var. burkii]
MEVTIEEAIHLIPRFLRNQQEAEDVTDSLSQPRVQIREDEDEKQSNDVFVTSAVDPSPSYTAEMKPTACSDPSSPSTTPSSSAIHLAFAVSVSLDGTLSGKSSLIPSAPE